jgi:hypothetical protein
MTVQGSTPGTGYTSPFGDGKGNVAAGGKVTGAHDFIADPKGSSPAKGSRDFSKESRDQEAKKDEEGDPNSESVPSDGKILLADPPAGSTRTSPIGAPGSTVKPFRLKGA